MDFSGTWKVYSEENLDTFLRVIGAPEMAVRMRKEVKPVLVIEQNGKDITISVKAPLRTQVNTFTFGKETEATALDGRKIKCVVTEENGRLITKSEKFTSVKEIKEGSLIETFTAGSVTCITRSKRI